MTEEIKETEHQNNEDQAIAGAPPVDLLLQKQAELEGHYKNICAQEVLLIQQLKKVQDQRESVATQLELVRSLAG